MPDASRIDRNAPQPFEVIGQLFKKLGADYGERQVLAAYDSSDPQGLLLVQEEWRHRLAGIDVRAIDWALENLGARHADWPPNVLQFANLCREWRPPLELDGNQQLGAPGVKPDPVRLERELSRYFDIRKKHLPHRLSWAERIVGRARRGENVSGATLAMARRALGILDGEATPMAATGGNFSPIDPEALPPGMQPAPQRPDEGPGEERFGS